MDYTLIEPVLRMILAVEFAFLAVAGLAGAVHCIALDGELRELSRQQQEILDGISDSLQTQKAVIDEKKKARMERLSQMV